MPLRRTKAEAPAELRTPLGSLSVLPGSKCRRASALWNRQVGRSIRVTLAVWTQPECKLGRLAGLPDEEAAMIHSRIPTAICIALLTLGAGSLCAQDVSLGGRLGAVAGAVLFEYEEANDLNRPMLGPQIGGVAAYRLSPIFSLQAELWYVQKGWIETRAGGARRLAYVELPLFLTATAPWRTSPQLAMGVSVGREVACSVTGVPGVGNLSCDDPRVEWHHRRVQFGTWAGFGVRRRFGERHPNIQLLGNLNLTNLSDEPLMRGYTRLLSSVVSVAYAVPLGRRTP